jgi:hypothetical protein
LPSRAPRVLARELLGYVGRVPFMPLRRVALALSTALVAVVAQPEDARACGGFFCSQAAPVNQAAERIVFADNGNGTVTAVSQILYQGPSESFSWLLPISTVPKSDADIAIASNVAFARLQSRTNPNYTRTTTPSRAGPEARAVARRREARRLPRAGWRWRSLPSAGRDVSERERARDSGRARSRGGSAAASCTAPARAPARP